MIDKATVTQLVNEAIEGTDLFLVDLTVGKDNRIVVEIDSRYHSIDIDTCAQITRAIEEKLDRDVEDYELEVGSAGFTAPFKVKEQYIKNIGNQVEVLTADGKKLRGELEKVDDNDFTILTRVKERVEGKKKPVEVERPVTISYADAKRVAYYFDFK